MAFVLSFVEEDIQISVVLAGATFIPFIQVKSIFPIVTASASKLLGIPKTDATLVLTSSFVKLGNFGGDIV